MIGNPRSSFFFVFLCGFSWLSSPLTFDLSGLVLLTVVAYARLLSTG